MPGRRWKKTALVAVADSSMAVLFQEREGIDYYILPYDGEVTDKAVALIQEGSYEVVVVYNQEYDDVMHRTFPESEESLQALKNHIAAFDRLCTAAEESWDTEDSLVVWGHGPRHPHQRKRPRGPRLGFRGRPKRDALFRRVERTVRYEQN